MNNAKVREYARQLVIERIKGDKGYYYPLVEFIAAIAEVDRRTVDVNILRTSNVDLTKLREAGL